MISDTDNNIFDAKNKSWVESKEKISSRRISEVLKYLYKYKIARSICISVLRRIEGGMFFSKTIRKILKEHHGVSVGKYTYGACMIPNALPKGTIIGAYCSIATDLKVFRRNHPLNTLSQHPFFYNKQLGLIKEDTIISDLDNPLEIGSDVWIGDSVTILPGCSKIGNGAVIGSASVVTKDVMAYEIVAGNPARKIRDRYDDETMQALEESRWWELSLLELIDAETLLFSKVNMANVKKYFDKQTKS